MTPEELTRGFGVGEWRVDPEGNSLRRGGVSHSLEPKVMDLLVYLASHAKTTVSKEEIFSSVWAETFVTDSALWRCISELRRVLEDDPANPRLIVTVPRRGYRLDAVVGPLPAASEERGHPASSRIRGIGLVAGLALLLLLAAWFAGSDSTGSADAPADRRTVLIARLDNRTGDDLLDDTLEVVLEGRLNDSRRVRVVSRARVEDSLRLMREPVDAPLTAKLARDVSQRDGDVDFLVTGQIDRLGSPYHVTLRLLNGRTHELVASKDMSCDSLEGMLPLADEQALWLLGHLGTHRPINEDKPERVTTRSLQALRLYTQGVERYRGYGLAEFLQRNTEAAQLFEQATQLDPEFASAYLMLAWSRFILDGADPKRVSREEMVFHHPWGVVVTRPVWDAIERAMATRGHASLVEREFIQGCYLEWKGELREAAGCYRLAANLQPEHRWAANNLTHMGAILGDSAIFSAGVLASSRILPLDWQRFGLRWLVQLAGDVEAARKVRKRLMSLGKKPTDAKFPPPGNGGDLRHESMATAAAFDVWDLWSQGRYAEAETSLGGLSRRVADLQTQGVDVGKLGYAHYLAGLQIMLGELADARGTQRLYDLQFRGESSATYLSSPALLLSFLAERPDPSGDPDELGFSKLLLGPPSAVHVQSNESDGPLIRELRSILRLADPGTRIDRLKAWISGLTWYQRQNTFYFFGGRWRLARELARQNRDAEAVATLEEIVADRNRTWVGGTVIWQKAALDLARAYRRQGRLKEAEPLLSELAKMLQFADADHPILRELRSMRLPNSTSERG